MKKILTTTVMTALLATNGFADEPVDYEVYKTANFPSGTDNNPTTIMPSGTVNVGKSGETPVIASKWTLQEGSTMNVTGNGFCLTKTLEINPKDAGGTYVQCAINGCLYYKYNDDNSSTAVYKLTNDSGNWVDASGENFDLPLGFDPTKVATTAVTGIPQIAANDDTARANAVIDMAYKAGPVTTTLPSDAKVVTKDTTTLEDGKDGSPKTCDLTKDNSTGQPLTFYVYDACLKDTPTEVYSTTKHTGTKINSLFKEIWNSENMIYEYSLCSNDLGTSNVYVKGTTDDTGNFSDDYYTQLSDGRYAFYGFWCSCSPVTNVSLKCALAPQGKICGGTVTYTKSGSATISNDTASNLVDTSLGGITGSQFVIGKATSDGFTEKYLENLPTLKYTDGNGVQQELTVAATSSYTNGELSGTGETLQTYLNSFGFYPKTVNVSGQTGLELIAGKTSNDAVLVPANYEFKQSANTTTHTIATNLHNTNQVFNQALTFTGENLTSSNQDTLVFSGDNSHLVPDEGVTYKNVNVTFSKANSWIAVPKNKTVTVENTAGTCSIIDIKDNLSICSNLKIVGNAKLNIDENKVVNFFGTLTLGGD